MANLPNYWIIPAPHKHRGTGKRMRPKVELYCMKDTRRIVSKRCIVFCYVGTPQTTSYCYHRNLHLVVLTQNAVLQRKLLVRKQTLERDEMKHPIHRVVRSNNADVSEKQSKDCIYFFKTHIKISLLATSRFHQQHSIHYYSLV